MKINLKKLGLSILCLILTITMAVSQGSGNWVYVHDGSNCSSSGTSGSCCDGRHEVSYVQSGDHFYYLGGRENDGRVNIYDPATQVWTVGATAPILLHHFQAIDYHGLILVIGAMTGDYPNEPSVGKIYIYDTIEDNWHEGPDIPDSRERGSAGCLVYNDEIYLVSGTSSGHSSGGWVTWVDKYNPSTDSWTTLANAPRARDHFQIAEANGKIYAVAGRRSGSNGTFLGTVSEVDVYDISSNTWSTGLNNIPTERAGNTVGIIGDELIVIGGEKESGLANSETEALNINNLSWRSLTDLNTGRHGSQAIVNNDNIWIAGGSPNRGGGQLQSQEKFYFGSDNNNPILVAYNASTLAGPSTLEVNGSETLTITANNGNQAVLLESITLSGSNTFSVESIDLPRIIPPNGTLEIQVNQSDDSSSAATLEFQFSNSDTPLLIQLETEGQTTTPVRDVDFWLEAECADVGSAWTHITDSNASRGEALTYTGGNSTGSSPSNASDRIRFNLDAEVAGNYELYARSKTPDNGSDSYWVRVNNGSWIRYNYVNYNNYSNSEYYWDQVGDWLSGSDNTPVSFNLSVGNNTIDFAYRENGISLDKLFVTLRNGQPNDIGQDDMSCDICVVGESCDDGDASTINDTYTSNCVCEGNVSITQTRYALQTGNIPGTIEAEYYDDGGQGIAYNDDTGKDGDTGFRPDTYVDSKIENGTYIVGWTNDDEWMEYTIDVATGTYNVTLVASSGNSNPGNVKVELDNIALTTIDVTSTGSWATYQDFTTNDITLSAGTNQVLKLTIIDGAKLDIDKIVFTPVLCNGIDVSLIGTPCEDGDSCTTGETYDNNCDCSGGTIIDSDNDGVCDANDVCNGIDDALIGISCDDGDSTTDNDVYTSDCECQGQTVSIQQTRYALQTSNIPGTIEAEYFDDGGQDIAYNDDSTRNGDLSFRSDTYVDARADNGSHVVGWIKEGEWLEYTVDVASGNYEISLIASAGGQSAGNVEVEIDGTLITTINVTPTGSFTTYENFTESNVTLSIGTNQVLKLTLVDGAYVDIDKIIFTDISCNGMVGAVIGGSCNDGDACTTGETYDSNCNCTGGEVIDSDNDGVCDIYDLCNGLDDALIGTSCNDGDSTTGNDVYTSNCECQGQTVSTPQTRYALQTGNIPGIIEAEYYDNGGQGIAYNDDTNKSGDTNFRSDTNVDAKAENGSYFIGWTNDDEWLEYTVDIAAGTYDVSLIASSGSSNPGNVKVEIDGTLLTTIDVTPTGSWVAFQEFTENNITLSGGSNQVLKLTIVDGANLDIDKIIFTESGCNGIAGAVIGSSCDDGNANTINDVYTSNCECQGQTVSTPQTRYALQTGNIPGIIEAEYYDNGGQGIAYNDDTNKSGDTNFRSDTNVDAKAENGSYFIGWTNDDEWLEYTVDIAAGTYDVSLIASSGSSNPGNVKVEIDGTLLTTIDVTPTGSWVAFQEFTENNITLSGGSNQVLKLTIVDGANLDIDKIIFTESSQPPNSSAQTDFFLEAECATVGSLWTQVNMNNASNETAYTYTNSNATGSADETPSGMITFTVDVDIAGSYEVYTRSVAAGGGDDSYWVRSNNDSWVRYNFVNKENYSASDFYWDQVGDWISGYDNTPVSFNLSEGANTIDFAYRENGIVLDKIYVTLDGVQPTTIGSIGENCSTNTDDDTTDDTDTIDSDTSISIPTTSSCEWHDLSDSNINRFEAASAKVNGKIYTFSGFTNGLNAIEETEIYDPITDTHTLGADMPIPVTHAGCTPIGDDVWIIAGFAGNHPGVAISDIQIYNTVSDSWSTGPNLPESRGGGAAVYLNGRVHYFGGLLPDRNTDVGDHWYIDVNNISAGWKSATPIPNPRNHLSGVALNGLIYAMGGQVGHDNGTEDQNFVDTYDFTTNSWTRVQELPVDRSHFEPGTMVHNGRILIAGGRDGNLIYDDILEYDPQSDSWNHICNIPDRLLAPGAKIVGNKLIVLNGGLNGHTNPLYTTRYIYVTPENGFVDEADSQGRVFDSTESSKVYPNPMTQSFNASLETTGEKIQSVEVYDMITGKRMYHLEVEGEENIGIDFDAAPCGKYMVKINTTSGNYYTETIFKL